MPCPAIQNAKHVLQHQKCSPKNTPRTLSPPIAFPKPRLRFIYSQGQYASLLKFSRGTDLGMSWMHQTVLSSLLERQKRHTGSKGPFLDIVRIESACISRLSFPNSRYLSDSNSLCSMLLTIAFTLHLSFTRKARRKSQMETNR